jgi:hypothetical protein
MVIKATITIGSQIKIANSTFESFPIKSRRSLRPPQPGKALKNGYLHQSAPEKTEEIDGMKKLRALGVELKNKVNLFTAKQ